MYIIKVHVRRGKKIALKAYRKFFARVVIAMKAGRNVNVTKML
jgi:hypothetical protein